MFCIRTKRVNFAGLNPVESGSIIVFVVRWAR